MVCWSCSCVCWSCSCSFSSWLILWSWLVTALFSALKSSSLIIAAARGVSAMPSAQTAAATLKMMERIFIGKFQGGLITAVFLEILQNDLGLRGGQIGPHPHVQHDRLPLGRRELGGIALRVAAIAIDGVQFGARELLWLRFFLRWLGVHQHATEAEAGQRQRTRQNYLRFLCQGRVHSYS